MADCLIPIASTGHAADLGSVLLTLHLVLAAHCWSL
jgi:hypothetical protein